MQNPVRFYISQSDDQPVVRTIPVAMRPCDVVEPTPAVAVAPAAAVEKAPAKIRVPRIVPGAAKRDQRAK